MKKFTLIFALLSIALSTSAAPLWMRYPAISPDGQKIAFTYKGDIYVVAANGGEAECVTPAECYDVAPVWSPDSKHLAYASDRYGNYDIFIVNANGGASKRVTTNSAKEFPHAFSTDGSQIYYEATIADAAQSALFPKSSLGELYAVSTNGGRPTRVLGTPAQAVNFSNDGKQFLYHDRKGVEDEWRKHHTSSITRDVWLYDTTSGKHTQLTDWAGEDRNPIFADNDKTVYFLSERGGTFNVWSFPTVNPAQAKQVTNFKTHPVRFLSLADNGTLCFGYNGEIYTMQKGGSPKKLAVEIIEKEPTSKSTLLNVSGGSYGTVSPDGKQIAFVSRGEVFVTSVEYPTTKQITNTPQSEISPSFAADNRTLAYASERNGKWNIYTATIQRNEEPDFPNATLIDEKPLFKENKIDRSYPAYSPDGKELAFVEDRCRLMVLNLESGKVRQITDGSKHYTTDGSMEFAWSPDSK